MVELRKLQRLACLGIRGAMRTTPTATVLALLGLPPLHLQLEAESKVGVYRLNRNDQWKAKSKEVLTCLHNMEHEEKPIL
jgi:hypothetical protein